MAASRGAEQDEMRRPNAFRRGSEPHPPGGRAGRRAAWLAAGFVGVLLPAAAFAQDSRPHASGPGPAPSYGRPVLAAPRGPPAPRPGGRPYRPSYGRWSPGQIMPSNAGAVVIADYQRFHLRRPPQGYSWLQCDGDFVLANATGLIFEVIPGGAR
jgi:Ni/Co efflux regulator RcnB